MSAPSSAAVKAAAQAFADKLGRSRMGYPTAYTQAAIDAAHDPALGLDRSVCLRDVVEALIREGDPSLAGGYVDAAEFIEHEFGGAA